MIVYEYPFNERVRAYLRLETLLRRLETLLTRSDAIDHYFAIATLFEGMDVSSRSDLKSDVLKDLERQRQQFNIYRTSPNVNTAALDQIIARVDEAYTRLHDQPTKPSQALAENEWLMAIRNRLGIPGGTCAFDLPGYFAWQHHSPQQRHADLLQWVQPFEPLANALYLLLRLFRDAGSPQKIATVRGQYQQNLPQNRSYQLLRLAMPEQSALIPEISGNRLMISIRMLHKGDNGQLTLTNDEGQYEMTLCA